jgi:CMP-N-acetylneuraminic acid synthetase
VNILGIIPARGGSKRLPEKNLKKIGGKALYIRVIEAALQSRTLSAIAISSDNTEILENSARYKNIEVIQRPAHISTEDSHAIDYVRHALDFMKEKGREFDAVVILQPSSPLTMPEDIDNTVNLLIRSGADTAVSVVKVAHMLNPLKLKIMEGDRLMPFIEDEKGRMTYKEIPEVYVRNCAVYATMKHVIEKGGIIGDDCRGYVMPPARSVDINDEFDFLFAEFLYSRLAINEQV